MRHSLVVGIVAWASAAAASPTLYVSCEDSGEIGVVDLAHGTATAWPVGKRPRGIVLSGDKLYVALSGSPKGGPEHGRGSVRSGDPSARRDGVDESKLPPPDRAADGIGEYALDGKRLRMLPSGQDPEAFDLDAGSLFVSNEETAELSVVDLATARVRARVKVGGEPEGVRLRPDGKVVYVTSEADNLVFAVDTAKLAVLGKIATPPRPRGVVFSADGRRAYVSSENGAAVTVVDGRRHAAIARIAIPNTGVTGPLPARPMGLALSADGRTLYVSNGRGGTVSIVDTAKRRVVDTIAAVGARPWGLALSADGKTLYSANGPSNDVSVIDLVAKKVARKIATCRGPWGLALR